MFNTAVTLKYNQGHWKWYGWVKLNEYYHHAKFDIYHIHSVQENCNVKVFATYRHLVSQPDTNHYTDLHFSCTSKTIAQQNKSSLTCVNKARKVIKHAGLYPKDDKNDSLPLLEVKHPVMYLHGDNNQLSCVETCKSVLPWQLPTAYLCQKTF